MSTVLRTALTTTLAFSAAFVLVESKLVPAAERLLVDHLATSWIQPWGSSTISPPVAPPLRHLAESTPQSFDPEPNAPPLRTEGSGTR